MKINYPIKYALMPIVDQVGWYNGVYGLERNYDTVCYIVSKCYLVGEKIKYNKDEGARLKGELNSAFEELKTTLNDIETYCVNRRSVPRDKIYSDHSVWNAIGEFFERVVDWDWTDDYEQFKKIQSNDYAPKH